MKTKRAFRDTLILILVFAMTFTMFSGCFAVTANAESDGGEQNAKLQEAGVIPAEASVQEETEPRPQSPQPAAFGEAEAAGQVDLEQKPAGTGRPRVHISARLAPLPPRRLRIWPLPSASLPPNR